MNPFATINVNAVSEAPQASPHTASVLRNLILFVGSTWLEESKNRPELRRVVLSGAHPQNQLVDLLGMNPEEGSAVHEEVVDMSVYLAEKMGSVGGLYWASGLLQVRRDQAPVATNQMVAYTGVLKRKLVRQSNRVCGPQHN